MAIAWSVADARAVAAHELHALGDRWAHVGGVGRLADGLVQEGRVPEVVAAAAWLHDVGYAPGLVDTGFHPIDGARWLRERGAPEELCSLVAHHTASVSEAEERGLVEALGEFPPPEPDRLDVLTLLDLSVGPTGELVTPVERVAEVLHRYPVGDPVHRAIRRSRPALFAAATRARARLGLADEWPLVTTQGVLQPETHRGV